jgi:hypothetical protein
VLQYWVLFGPGWAGVVTFGGGVDFGLLAHCVEVIGLKREARARDVVRAAERGEGFPLAAGHRGGGQDAVEGPDGRGLNVFSSPHPVPRHSHQLQLHLLFKSSSRNDGSSLVVGRSGVGWRWHVTTGSGGSLGWRRRQRTLKVWALCARGLRQRVKTLKPYLPRKKVAGVKLLCDCGEASQSPASTTGVYWMVFLTPRRSVVATGVTKPKFGVFRCT